MNGLHPRAARQRLGRRRVRRSAHGRASTSCAAVVEPYTPERVARDLRRRRPTTSRRAARDLRHRRAGALHRAAGLLPVAPGHRRGLPGEQPAPAARHDRPARRRNPADERAADSAEQPRVRRRRRPARLPQLGEPGARPAAGASCGTSTRYASRTGRRRRTRCRSSATSSRARSSSSGSSATNPAVSMPRAARASARILEQESCFLVVQDLFLTETAELADVVLPAAGWGEKTGTFTNVDRTVHLSDKAVEPPGEARSRPRHLPRLRPADGLPRRATARRCSTGRTRRTPSRPGRSAAAGRPCDYTGLSYEKLRGGSGIPWPCNDEHPEGTDRLYADGVFPTRPDYCESLRARPVDGRRRSASRAYRALRARRPGGPQGRPVHTAARGAERASTRCCYTTGRTVVPVPHPHQDRRGRVSCTGGTRGVGRARRGRRGAARHRARATSCGSTRRAARSWSRPGSGDVRDGHGVRPLPLRLLGPRRARARAAPRPTS